MVVSAGNFPVLVHHAVLCNLHPLGCFPPRLFAEALQEAGKIRPVPVYLVKIAGRWLVVVVVCKRGCPVAFPEIRIGQLAEIPVSYTHLDVYKRQAKTVMAAWLAQNAPMLAKEMPPCASFSFVEVFDKAQRDVYKLSLIHI